MASFIERLVLPVQVYLKLTLSDQLSATSQNLSTMMITNANLTAKTSTNLISSLVFSKKDKDLMSSSLNTTSTRLSAQISDLEKHFLTDMSGDLKQVES